MTVETATFLAQLQAAYPADGDTVEEGDNHIRLIKAVLQATFPNFNAAVTATPAELNYLDGVAANIISILQAADYAAVRALLSVPTNAEAILHSLLTTEGDTIVRGASATERLAKGSEGQVKQVLNGNVVWGARSLHLSPISTSGGGVSVSLTPTVKIPSWARRVTLTFKDVSLDGGATVGLRVGPSSGVVTTGYNAASMRLASDDSNVENENVTTGFELFQLAAAASAIGVVHIEKHDPASHTWMVSAVGLRSLANLLLAGGYVDLAGDLSELQVYSSNGSDQFDSGEIGIRVEG